MAGSRNMTLLALVLAAWAGAAARADVGGVVASGRAGPFRASVLVSPTPPRAGPAEWSVLLQDAGGAPVLDAEVELELHRHGASGHHAHRVVAARREASTNRLLYSALVDLPEPGTWQVALRVTRGEHGQLGFELPVGPATGRAGEHWRALSLPPIAHGLFALHQWLSRGERRRARHPEGLIRP